MMIVGFDKEPPTEIDDILAYAGFDPNSAGKNLWGKITRYKVSTNVKGVEIQIVKFLDENIQSDYLTLVFKNAIPPERERDQLFTRKRVKQVEGVTTELVTRLRLTPENTFENYAVEDMVALVFKDAAPTLDAVLAEDSRNAFTLIDGDEHGS
jgi:hypothetical protein